MKKYLPMILCGFGAAVLNIVPKIEELSCCLIIPLASVFSLMLYQKSNNDYSRITTRKAFKSGALTGSFAAFFWTIFNVLIAFVTKNSEINENLPEIKKLFSTLPDSTLYNSYIGSVTNMANEISRNGYSNFYTMSTFISSIMVYTVFGILGSLIGMRILNNRSDFNL